MSKSAKFKASRLVLGALIGLGAQSAAYAVNVTVEVDWPNWSSDNRVTIKSPAGATLQTICDPVNCFNASANTSYSNTFTYNFPEDFDYIIDIEDAFGDAWNGDASVKVYSDGKLVFQDAGPPTNFQTETFDVSPQASLGTQSCSSLTGGWAGNSAVTSSGVNVSVTTSNAAGGNWISGTDIMNTINAFSETTVQGHTALLNAFYWDATPEGGTTDSHDDGVTGTYTFTFDRPVINPVFHFDRFGGSATSTGGVVSSNSARLSLTSGGTLVRLAGPDHFEVLNKFVQRTPFEIMSVSETQSNLNSSLGTTAGSLYVSGTHTSVTFATEGVGVEGAGGDEFEVVVCADPSDFADAPSGYGSAGHIIKPGPTLGALRDSDITFLNSADALGDDNDNQDDEDSLSVMPVITDTSSTVTIPATDLSVAGDGVLHAWIDFDKNGTFDAGEYASTAVTAGTLAGDLSWTGLSGLTPGATFLRLRVTSDTDISSGSAALPAKDGEAEDFGLTIISSPAVLEGSKDVEIWDPLGAGLYAVPGNDVIYTITALNTGDGPTDVDSVVLIDVMPTEVEFYNGDIDDGGPETDPVSFTQTGAGLSFTYGTDVGYSNSTTRPASFADCNYGPAAGYDPAVTYICFNPKGVMAAGDPDPSFAVSFRARIK